MITPAVQPHAAHIQPYSYSYFDYDILPLPIAQTREPVRRLQHMRIIMVDGALTSPHIRRHRESGFSR